MNTFAIWKQPFSVEVKVFLILKMSLKIKLKWDRQLEFVACVHVSLSKRLLRRSRLGHRWIKTLFQIKAMIMKEEEKNGSKIELNCDSNSEMADNEREWLCPT